MGLASGRGTGNDEGRDDLVFKALSDPTRRRILSALAEREMPAGQVAAMFPISGPSVSRHLGVLRSAGLVRETREGNRLICSLVREPLVASVTGLAGALHLALEAAGPRKKGKTEGRGDKKKAKAGKKRGDRSPARRPSSSHSTPLASRSTPLASCPTTGGAPLPAATTAVPAAQGEPMAGVPAHGQAAEDMMIADRTFDNAR